MSFFTSSRRKTRKMSSRLKILKMARLNALNSLFTPSFFRMLLPFTHWSGLVNRNSLKADAIAGLTNAVVVLPQGVAFAMIAGLPPQYGLYTAIVTPIVAALFGSSRHLISGPTTAISIVVFSAVSGYAEPGSPEFVTMALTMTFLAGVYQLAFGLARLGRLVDFVSHSVVVGFTAGAAILIASSQVEHVLGIFVPRGDTFLHKWEAIAASLGDANAYVIGLSVFTFLFAVVVKRMGPRWPHLLLAMVAGSVLSIVLDGPTHGIRLIGEIPARLPPFSMPDMSIAMLARLTPDAFAIALLGLIEAVSIGRSIAIQSRQHLDGNQEFIGQGLSNIVGSFFSCYAGSGSFTRSGINYAAGARTPMAAIFAAVFLAAIILLAAPLTAFLPFPAMGAIILLVAYKLIDFQHIRTILRVSSPESAVLVLTFGATLLLDLQFAIYAGILLSLVLYLNRVAHPRIVSIAPKPDSSTRKFTPLKNQPERRCPQLEIVEINGSIFFGSATSIMKQLSTFSGSAANPRHILLVADSVNLIDVSGAEMLAQEAVTWQERGGGLYICGLNFKDKVFLNRGGYLNEIGRRNIFESKKRAITAILGRLDGERCLACPKEVFLECRSIKEKAAAKAAP